MEKTLTSRGILCPIIREGDNLAEIVAKAVLEATAKDWSQMDFGGASHEVGYYLNNKDVIGITESVIARAASQYVTVDEIAKDIKQKFGDTDEIVVLKPIYSRNRFSMILKGIARATKKIIFIMPRYDEVGNPVGVNPFTGVDIQKYYGEICQKENCDFEFLNHEDTWYFHKNAIYCGLHDYKAWKDIYNPPQGRTDGKTFLTLADLCTDKNPDFGLLGTNKATEEKLKLFPTKKEAKRVCTYVKYIIKNRCGRDVVVMAYGDGSYKDLDAGIWEMADPVSSPGYTDEELLDSTPNEVKVKALADDKFKDLSGKELEDAIKEEIKANAGKNLKGNMVSQGTTPRRYVNLLASLMDLTSGSGDRCTPVVLVQNYFR